MAQYNFLDTVAKHESGWRNIHQNVVPAGGGFNPSTGTVTGPSSASGYFQITNTTWRSIAPAAGIDTSQYPTAMSAPYDVQRSAASALYARGGGSDWIPYNAGLRSEIASKGGLSNFGGDNVVASNAPESVTGSRYTPPYENFSPSGYDYAGDAAPGSFSDKMPTNVGYEQFSGANVSSDVANGKFGLDTGENWKAGDTETASQSASAIDNASYITGDQVSDPKAAAQGQGISIPQAIVTAANQEAQTAASAAKTTAEAALKAAQTTTASDAKLQGESQSWASNWAVRIFLFIIGAIFVGGALFLLGGQTIFQNKA